MFLALMFFFLCVAASAVIAVFLRDSHIYGELFKYITILQTHGDDSEEEYNFRANASTSIADLCHLVRASRDDASHKSRCKVEDEIVARHMSKTKRASKPNHGKDKK